MNNSPQNNSSRENNWRVNSQLSGKGFKSLITKLRGRLEQSQEKTQVVEQKAKAASDGEISELHNLVSSLRQQLESKENEILTIEQTFAQKGIRNLRVTITRLRLKGKDKPQ